MQLNVYSVVWAGVDSVSRANCAPSRLKLGNSAQQFHEQKSPSVHPEIGWLCEGFVIHALCGGVQTHPSKGNPLLTRLSFLFELVVVKLI